MSLAKFFRHPLSIAGLAATSDGASYTIAGIPTQHTAVDLETIVGRLEQDVSLTLRLIQDNSIEAKAKVDESIALAGRIQSASKGLATLSGHAKSTAAGLAHTAYALEQSNEVIRAQSADSDKLLGDARDLTSKVGIEMSGLSNAAKSIAAVVDIIRSIARQTNMVALNAAIEASRAGAASRGFSVVAGEVKSLANDAHNATTTVAGHIRDLEQAVSGAAISVSHMVELFGRIEPLLEAINASATNQIVAAQDVAAKANVAAEFADSVASDTRSMHELAEQAAMTTHLAGVETQRMEATVDRLSSRSMFYFRQSIVRDRRTAERVPFLHPVMVEQGSYRCKTYLLEYTNNRLKLPPLPQIADGLPVRIESGAFGIMAGEIVARSDITTTLQLSALSSEQALAFDQFSKTMSAEVQAQAKLIQVAADQISRMFKQAVNAGTIAHDALLTEDYRKIPGTSPPQYQTDATDFYDSKLHPMVEAFRNVLPNAIFVMPVDRHSYVPVHYKEYSLPQRFGQTAWNDLNCRNRRIMTRAQTSQAVRNDRPYVASLYVREMSDGTKAYCRLISAPIRVHEHLWGNLMCAVEMTAHL